MIFRSNVEGKMNKSAEKQATKRGKHTQNKMKWKKETLLTMDLEQSNTFFMWRKTKREKNSYGHKNRLCIGIAHCMVNW